MDRSSISSKNTYKCSLFTRYLADLNKTRALLLRHKGERDVDKSLGLSATFGKRQ